MGEVTASEIVDLLVIGAGPTGLACAIEAERAGFSALLVKPVSAASLLTLLK